MARRRSRIPFGPMPIALVVGFIETCLTGRDLARAPEFIGADRYIPHDADRGDGVRPFTDLFEGTDGPFAYQACFTAVAEGNFGAPLNRATPDRQDLCQVDPFRVEGGNIVEHWGNAGSVPPAHGGVKSGSF